MPAAIAVYAIFYPWFSHAQMMPGRLQVPLPVSRDRIGGIQDRRGAPTLSKSAADEKAMLLAVLVKLISSGLPSSTTFMLIIEALGPQYKAKMWGRLADTEDAFRGSSKCTSNRGRVNRAGDNTKT